MIEMQSCFVYINFSPNISGPNKDTLRDFWRMLWEIEANRLIMVTNIVEMSKVGIIKNYKFLPKSS